MKDIGKPLFNAASEALRGAWANKQPSKKNSKVEQGSSPTSSQGVSSSDPRATAGLLHVRSSVDANSEKNHVLDNFLDPLFEIDDLIATPGKEGPTEKDLEDPKILKLVQDYRDEVAQGGDYAGLFVASTRQNLNMLPEQELNKAMPDLLDAVKESQEFTVTE